MVRSDKVAFPALVLKEMVTTPETSASLTANISVGTFSLTVIGVEEALKCLVYGVDGTVPLDGSGSSLFLIVALYPPSVTSLSGNEKTGSVTSEDVPRPVTEI